MPDLLKKPDQIAKVILQDSTHTLTLQKAGDVWQVSEKNNYPVLREKVEELIYSLADLRVVEPKTSNKEYYKQLDVNDIAEADSQAVLITITDKYNDSIVKLYIGKREGINLGEEYKENIFVRRANEDQAWLVQGVIPLSNDFRDWVEQPLLGIIESDQIKRVEIEKNKGGKVTITKDKQEQEDFSLTNVVLKKDMVLDLDAVNTVPFEMAELEFNDVRPASNNLDWNNGITATLETFPGVKVVLNMIRDGDKVLAKVQANASEASKPELQQKVLTFNQAKSAWVYELSPDIYKELALSNDDFLKPKEVE